MNLDKAKDAWQKSSSQPAIDRQKIEYMINKGGVSSFMKMKRYCRRSGIFCLLYGLLLFILAISFTNMNSKLFCLYAILLFIAGAWSIYCYCYLNKIDLGKTNLATFSSRFNRFRKWEKWEWMGKAIFIIIVISSLIYVQYDYIIELNRTYKAVYIAGNILLMSAAAGAGLLIYRKFYSKNLKKVENALKEIEDLKEN